MCHFKIIVFPLPYCGLNHFLMPCHGSQYIKGFVIVIVAAEDVEVVFIVWGSNPA